MNYVDHQGRPMWGLDCPSCRCGRIGTGRSHCQECRDYYDGKIEDVIGRNLPPKERAVNRLWQAIGRYVDESSRAGSTGRRPNPRSARREVDQAIRELLDITSRGSQAAGDEKGGKAG